MDDRSIELLKSLENANIDRRKFLQIMSAAGLSSFIGANKVYASSSSAKAKVVILGGGAAGISVAARLMNILDTPDITLVDPSEKQFYQPGFTFIGSGVFTPNEVWKKQSDCIPSGVNWIKEEVAIVDPVNNVVSTTKGTKINYDFMILAPGCQCNWSKIEGMSKEMLGQGGANSVYDFDGSQKTWTAIQDLAKKGGRGISVDTHTKYKCGGVPKKMVLLAEHHMRKQGVRNNVKLDYFTASTELYDVPYYTPRLLDIYNERGVSITYQSKVKGIDTGAKQLHLEQVKTVDGKKITTLVKEDYDFLHFAPPMSAPDFVRNSGLGWTDGKLAADAWAMVDQFTLVHKLYSNIIALGDVAGVPTSKTSAATRIQIPVAVDNLIALMEGKNPTSVYNGYACCPIVTDYGHVILAEFDYKKEKMTSFPFNFFDTSQEIYPAWLLKRYVLKPLFFYGMLNGWA